MRYTVTRNFVFVPWDERYHFEEDSSGKVSLQSEHGPSPWLAEEPSRFLYCHQKHSTRDDFKGDRKIYNTQYEYIVSDRYAANMQVGHQGRSRACR